MFAQQDFKQRLAEMMQELKESFSIVTSSDEVNNKLHPQQNMTKGGIGVLDEKLELVNSYGLDVESLDFSIDELSMEELEEKLLCALNSNIQSEIMRKLEEVKTETEWGVYSRYCYADCDLEAHEVYAWDSNDWLLYGFTYTQEGDSIAIDFESVKRKKYVIADFEEGEQASPFAPMFADIEQRLEQKIHDNSELETKYQAASDTVTSMQTELNELRQYKADVEERIAESKRAEIFAQFEELEGIEAFEALKENCKELELDVIEEKCFAIRGRNGISAAAKYSLEKEGMPKIIVARETVVVDAPYGGIVEEYLEKNN